MLHFFDSRFAKFVAVSMVVMSIVLIAWARPQSAPPVVSNTYENAVALAATGDIPGALASLHIVLDQKPEHCQRALLDSAFIGLRDQKEFRDLMRKVIVKHKISSLTLAPPDEPGQWVEIDGLVVDAQKKPLAGAVVTVFGTAKDGRYHPTIDGEDTPRLFGYLVADDHGKFRFRTIRPGPYPGTRNAEHFHIWASAPGKRMAAPHYAVLSDDPLLQLPENAEQRGEAVRVIMQEKGADGVAHGTVELPMR